MVARDEVYFVNSVFKIPVKFPMSNKLMHNAASICHAFITTRGITMARLVAQYRGLMFTMDVNRTCIAA